MHYPPWVRLCRCTLYNGNTNFIADITCFACNQKFRFAGDMYIIPLVFLSHHTPTAHSRCCQENFNSTSTVGTQGWGIDYGRMTIIPGYFLRAGAHSTPRFSCFLRFFVCNDSVVYFCGIPLKKFANSQHQPVVSTELRPLSAWDGFRGRVKHSNLKFEFGLFKTYSELLLCYSLGDSPATQGVRQSMLGT